MGRLIDVDDLLDMDGIAKRCGLANRNVVAACLSEGVGSWADFPRPVFDRGRCRLWLSSEVGPWDDERKANPRKRGPKKAAE